MAATLDGLIKETGAVFEAKFMLPWSFSKEAAAEKHMAQLQRFFFGASDDRYRRHYGGEGRSLADRRQISKPQFANTFPR